MIVGFSLVATLGILAVWACTQEDGGRCQLNSDCASSYCCKPPVGSEPTTDGVCVANEAACNAIWGGDSGTETDAAHDDAGSEAEAEAEADAEAEAEADTPTEAEAEAETEGTADTAGDATDAPTDSVPETDL
jgi:hypothetical protein